MTYLLLAAILGLIVACAWLHKRINDLRADLHDVHTHVLRQIKREYDARLNDKAQIVAELAKHHRRLQELEKP